MYIFNLFSLFFPSVRFTTNSILLYPNEFTFKMGSQEIVFVNLIKAVLKNSYHCLISLIILFGRKYSNTTGNIESGFTPFFFLYAMILISVI